MILESLLFLKIILSMFQIFKLSTVISLMVLRRQRLEKLESIHMIGISLKYKVIQYSKKMEFKNVGSYVQLKNPVEVLFILKNQAIIVYP